MGPRRERFAAAADLVADGLQRRVGRGSARRTGDERHQRLEGSLACIIWLAKLRPVGLSKRPTNFYGGR